MYRLWWEAVYHTGSVSSEGSAKKRLVIKILEQRIAWRRFYPKNRFTSADVFVEGSGRNVRKPPVCGHNSSTGYIWCTKRSQGKTHEGIYRRTGGPDRQLHHRRECYGAPDGEKVWDIEEYGTHGSNKLDIVFCMRVCFFVRDIFFLIISLRTGQKKCLGQVFMTIFWGFY